MAFFFLLLYIIIIYMRPGEWIPFFYGWQLMDITAILAVICLAMETARSRRSLVKVPQNVFMLGFLGALVLSHLSHTYFGGAWEAFLDFSKKVILYFMIVNILTTERKLKIFIELLILLTTIIAIQGISMHNTGIGWAGQLPDQDGRIKWIGIFQDANDLALALVMIVPFLLSLILKPSRFVLKLVVLPMLAVFLYSIYLTNSRGGLLALMVVVFLYFAISFRKIWQRVIGTVVGIGAASLVFIYGPSRLAMLNTQEESAFNRVESWYEGFQMFKSNPLFGVGKGMFTEDYRLVAHNSFIHTAAESGLFGYFFWIGLFYISIKYLLSVQSLDTPAKEMRDSKTLANAMVVSFAGLLAAMFFLSRSYIELPYLLIGLSGALYHIVSQKNSQVLKPVVTFSDIRNICFLEIASLVVIYAVIKVVL